MFISTLLDLFAKHTVKTLPLNPTGYTMIPLSAILLQSVSAYISRRSNTTNY